MDENVDALVRAFASDNDGVIVAADEGGAVNGPAATQTAMASSATPATVRVVLLRMHWGIYPTDHASFLFPYHA